MKPISIFIFALCATAQITAANAATKCVALGTSTTCTYVDPLTQMYDWSSTCTTGSASAAVTGIGVCSETAGTTVGETKNDRALHLDSQSTDNKYCWCKMISPAVSKWVYSGIYESVQLAGSSALCLNYCAQSCAQRIKNTAAFRTALFSNMTD